LRKGLEREVRHRPDIGFLAALMVLSAPSHVIADDEFSDVGAGKLHAASGFTCPAKIATFERDAVGERDPQAGAVYCAYSKLDGVYGTVVLKPLRSPYDARSSLSGAFEETQSTGGQMIGEQMMKLGQQPEQLDVYSRSYETAHLSEAHYRVLFTGASVGNWAVELTIEYADPRDTDTQKEFLNAVYSAATAEIGAASPQARPMSDAH
jgi:hypothetical protein